ncbi:pirin family protein [Acetobacter orleanensis]|uniref:Quercetin 2,3-dioxygenase C-terminal cupin domain-containing protein n=1 Tax=Acetobacter orleanensis TaxID=104099 RepID=A0A4Y3TRP1_9PROT|nr:hypothetical protein [Acetobacter orleanensis]KXV66323.1 pirin [Acetobacter orleanensis]PCD78532.1 hypothetical protein CO710_11635 [Acetobacter orleanensis]GAN69160.1 iron-binding nuclear protein Pirin [Acetobacter orleanensis JCM 7639]GBR29926.1 pirin [Acetobacter orleanensis NRIC 0473]GEB83747.1 hypothetical protein AOR01nite_22240 [Acetobacter orleanensis]
MITVRQADTLGVTQSDTLTLRCYFAFADYQDPVHQHEGRLRVLNQGELGPSETYHLGPEAADDIVTWVWTGSLVAQVDGFEPEDIQAGGLHFISAGSGCTGLSWQAGAEGAAFLQFWFLPDMEGGMPRQESRSCLDQQGDGGFSILASGFPEDNAEESEDVTDDGPVALRASARLLHAAIPAGEGAAYNTSASRDLYLVVVSGTVSVEESVLKTGDAAAVQGVQTLTVMAQEQAVILLTDVAQS